MNELENWIPPEVKTFETGGKGKKQCCKCLKYVGGSTKVCICGHIFSKDDKLIRVLNEQEKELMVYLVSLGKTPQDKIVITPVGDYDVKLETIDRDNVFDWADQVIDLGKREQKIFTIDALKYLLAKQVGYQENYKLGCTFLKEWQESLICM